MNRRIVICDDESTEQNQVCTYLRELQAETGDSFETFFFSSGEEFLENIPANLSVVLLDIQMKGISGLEVARTLRKDHPELHIIFITSNVQYALQGYDVHAFAFLRKPLQYASLKRHLKEAFAQLDAKRGAVLTFPTGNGSTAINMNELVYVEVLRHLSTLVCVNRSVALMMPLQEIENRIIRYGFFRCHKSFLINMKYIAQIRTDEIETTTGKKIPLSKYRHHDMLEAYALYMGEKI